MVVLMNAAEDIFVLQAGVCPNHATSFICLYSQRPDGRLRESQPHLAGVDKLRLQPSYKQGSSDRLQGKISLPYDEAAAEPWRKETSATTTAGAFDIISDSGVLKYSKSHDGVALS